MPAAERIDRDRDRPPTTRKGPTMDFNSTSFWDVLLWSLWFFILIAAIMIWFRCILDMFSDHTLSGWGKAGWALLLIFVPWLGAFIYLIARGKSMRDRQEAAIAEAQASQEKYIKEVAAKSASPAEQIASAKSLLDSGAISQAEFDALKAKAMA
jgi:Short C-terminal domain/Phospholipase_D-nuclease N-terminal